MYRTNTCGELRLSDAGKEVTLAGWVQRSPKMGGMTSLTCVTDTESHRSFSTKLMT